MIGDPPLAGFSQSKRTSTAPTLLIIGDTPCQLGTPALTKVMISPQAPYPSVACAREHMHMRP